MRHLRAEARALGRAVRNIIVTGDELCRSLFGPAYEEPQPAQYWAVVATILVMITIWALFGWHGYIWIVGFCQASGGSAPC
jgi:hypothetical protein